MGAGFTCKNIRNKLGVANGCITNISKKWQQCLSLKNRSGKGWKKSTISKEDRHLTQSMKKYHEQSDSKWTSSNENPSARS